MTQAQAVLNQIVGNGAHGASHEQLEWTLNLPKASVRRITQQLRQQGRIRVSHYEGAVTVFVDAAVRVEGL